MSSKFSDRLLSLIKEQGGPGLLTELSEKLEVDNANRIASVSYAGTITNSQQQEIENTLKKRFPSIEQVEYKESADLIGGLRVQYRDFVFDDSIKTKLVGLQLSK